ncbi:hypothetical protein GGI43DRAFT_330137 [Trichoderma evansii]
MKTTKFDRKQACKRFLETSCFRLPFFFFFFFFAHSQTMEASTMESWHLRGFFFKLNNDIESYSLILLLWSNSLFRYYKVLTVVYRVLAIGLKELRVGYIYIGLLHAKLGSCEHVQEYM